MQTRSQRGKRHRSRSSPAVRRQQPPVSLETQTARTAAAAAAAPSVVPPGHPQTPPTTQISTPFLPAPPVPQRPAHPPRRRTHPKAVAQQPVALAPPAPAQAAALALDLPIKSRADPPVSRAQEEIPPPPSPPLAPLFADPCLRWPCAGGSRYQPRRSAPAAWRRA